MILKLICNHFFITIICKNIFTTGTLHWTREWSCCFICKIKISGSFVWKWSLYYTLFFQLTLSVIEPFHELSFKCCFGVAKYTKPSEVALKKRVYNLSDLLAFILSNHNISHCFLYFVVTLLAAPLFALILSNCSNC